MQRHAVRCHGCFAVVVFLLLFSITMFVLLSLGMQTKSAAITKFGIFQTMSYSSCTLISLCHKRWHIEWNQRGSYKDVF